MRLSSRVVLLFRRRHSGVYVSRFCVTERTDVMVGRILAAMICQGIVKPARGAKVVSPALHRIAACGIKYKGPRRKEVVVMIISLRTHICENI